MLIQITNGFECCLFMGLIPMYQKVKSICEFSVVFSCQLILFLLAYINPLLFFLWFNFVAFLNLCISAFPPNVVQI
jgi:hypothetical protein